MTSSDGAVWNFGASFFALLRLFVKLFCECCRLNGKSTDDTPFPGTIHERLPILVPLVCHLCRCVAQKLFTLLARDGGGRRTKLHMEHNLSA